MGKAVLVKSYLKTPLLLFGSIITIHRKVFFKEAHLPLLTTLKIPEKSAKGPRVPKLEKHRFTNHFPPFIGFLLQNIQYFFKNATCKTVSLCPLNTQWSHMIRQSLACCERVTGGKYICSHPLLLLSSYPNATGIGHLVQSRDWLYHLNRLFLDCKQTPNLN